MFSSEKDGLIIEQLLSGNAKKRTKALNTICSLSYAKVENYLVKKGSSKEETKDIFQDAITIFYQNVVKSTFKRESSIDTYLLGICKNLWLQKIKKNQKDQQLMAHLTLPENGVDQEPALNIDLLKATFDELKKDCQELLTYFYYEKKPISDIKQILNVSSDQVVKNKKSRCLGYLMNIIKSKNLTKEMFYDE
ncbi:MAG: sigma-70 family RNA polymerase sigma factor [Bacteroidota bacterium]